MYLGNPYLPDAEDKLRGVHTSLTAQIHITDGQTDEILDYITAKHIISDNHQKSLKDGIELYEFRTFEFKAEHLEKRNRVIIPDEDGTLREFVIFEAHKYLDSQGRKAEVYAHATHLEIKKQNIIEPGTYEGTASQLVGIALNGTDRRPRKVEVEGTRTIEVDRHTNPYDFLKRIAREFDGELVFPIEHDGNRVTGRYVDFVEQSGEWRGREVTIGKELDSIRRIEKQDIVTALLGIGPEDEEGNRIEVLVEDEDALQRWGWIDERGNLQHLIESYEIQSERLEMTEEEARQYTRTALDKRINTQVEYEATIIDLENVPGMENKQIRFGDTIRIKDEHFNPPLYVEARVFEIERSIKSRAKTNIKLGDYIEYTEEEVHAIWMQLRNEIRKRVSVAQLEEYAEPKIIESATPPPIEQGENAKWIDTSGEIKVPHVVVGNEWVKMSPTEHDISDADRLSSGIIDVGQVPLRTSVSGARIEWDGVNGLVQYDANNNVVTHLSLDGDATFSGHLEGASGSFSGKITSIRYVTPNHWNLVEIDDGVVQAESIDPLDGTSRRIIVNGYGISQETSSFGESSEPLGILGRYGITFNSVSGEYLFENNMPARFTGSLKLENADGVDNALEFPKGHKLSVGELSGSFLFYGNRGDGQSPFVVRSHNNESGYRNDLEINYNGHIVSEKTYENTSSNAANLRVGTTGTFYRTTSAKKYKHDIQLSDVDPYKILDLEIKSWYDKREYEENGKSTDGLRRYHALVADDVADVLPEFADYNHEGEVENYNDRVFSLLIPIVRELKERLDDLESN